MLSIEVEEFLRFFFFVFFKMPNLSNYLSLPIWSEIYFSGLILRSDSLLSRCVM